MEARRKQSQLEHDTAAYFENMTVEELKAERDLESTIAGAAQAIDLDSED
jgi:hypothetical protein